MTSFLLFSFCLFQGTYFSDTRVYDPDTHTLRQGLHVLLGSDGRIEAVGLKPIKIQPEVEQIQGALLLPHYADFYALLQERGLGLDEDISLENQQRMAETFRHLGIDKIRDPIFPPNGVSVALKPFQIFAQRGYLALKGSKGAGFGLVIDPSMPMEQVLSLMPPKGPITLWWTNYGGNEPLKWERHRSWLQQFIEALHARKRIVGAYVEGARKGHIRSLMGLDFDFLEGIPDDVASLTTTHFPDCVWVPLLALNDKRYCAADLHKRLIPLKRQQLYSAATIERARAMSRQVQASMLDRCKVWRKRRPAILAQVQNWAQNGGELGLGSAGGHPFSFTGELLPELKILREAKVTDDQLLKALFKNTPGLLGPLEDYLTVGKPAHFIVYRNGTAGLNLLGTSVDLNFHRGQLLRTPLSPSED